MTPLVSEKSWKTASFSVVPSFFWPTANGAQQKKTSGDFCCAGKERVAPAVRDAEIRIS